MCSFFLVIFLRCRPLLIFSFYLQCEDLSSETGCWLFLGAQHLTARGGAITYASPRLCREAPAPAGQLAMLFGTTATQLMNARRSEAVMYQRQLDDMREKRADAEKKAEHASAMIAEYERRFGRLEN